MWNATIKDWVFVHNNEKEDTYWTGRVLEELPDAGEKEGQIFDGWYWDKDFTNAVIVPCTTTETIPMIYARWRLIVNVEVLDDEEETWQSFKNIKVNITVSDIITELVQTYKYQVTTLYADKDFTTEITNDSQLSLGCTLYCTGTFLPQYEFDYTGTVQPSVLRTGTYKLECWGAQGGSSWNNSYAGGKGGYSYGTLTIATPIQFIVTVGGAGSTSANSNTYAIGGFNGGGDTGTGNRSSTTQTAGSGGGGTDIRLSTDSLYARVIVAGGGGGGGYSSNGGAGGGISGIRAGTNSRDSYPGTATSGGASAIVPESNPGMTAGTFGIGGRGGNYGYSGGAGGGGGWFGAGGAGGGASNFGCAAGGSGYVYTSDTAVNYPTGCLLSEAYYLSDAETIAGNSTFTSPDGTEETGHSGNGYVRITKLS